VIPLLGRKKMLNLTRITADSADTPESPSSEMPSTSEASTSTSTPEIVAYKAGFNESKREGYNSGMVSLRCCCGATTLFIRSCWPYSQAFTLELRRIQDELRAFNAQQDAETKIAEVEGMLKERLEAIRLQFQPNFAGLAQRVDNTLKQIQKHKKKNEDLIREIEAHEKVNAELAKRRILSWRFRLLSPSVRVTREAVLAS
jgi:hypothetical protein